MDIENKAIAERVSCSYRYLGTALSGGANLGRVCQEYRLRMWFTFRYILHVLRPSILAYKHSLLYATIKSSIPLETSIIRPRR
jgi:hypothetical protein